LIDQDELDWKILCINEEEAHQRNISNVEEFLKGEGSHTKAIVEWFRTIKVPDGKKPNKFGFNEGIVPQERVLKIIDECNEEYKGLKQMKNNGFGFWLG